MKHVVTRVRYYASASAVAALVVLLAVYGQESNDLLQRAALRQKVAARVSLMQSKLDASINANIMLMQGLAASFATNPDLDQEQFNRLTRRILEVPSQLRQITVAPDFKVRFAYPPNLQKQLVGYDYEQDPLLRNLVARVSSISNEDGRVASVPFSQQGQMRIMISYPIFSDGKIGDRKLWGVLTGTIDLGAVLCAAGLCEDQNGLPLVVSLRSQTSGIDDPLAIYGDAAATRDAPVTATIRFLNSAWLLEAAPRQGWTASVDLSDRELEIWGVAFAIIAQLVLTVHLLVQRSRHVTTLREREASLLALTRCHDIALEASSVGLWEHSLIDGGFFADERMTRLYGLQDGCENRQIKAFHSCILREDLTEVRQKYDDSIRSGNRFEVEFRIRRVDDNNLRYIRSFGRFYSDGPQSKLVGLQQDITADIMLRKALEKAHAETEHISLHDALSGLPNRRYFDRVLVGLDSEAGADERFLLLHIDLDHFKQVNDTLGHAAGDAVIREASQRITAQRRGSDFVARVGGDEFVVICRRAELSFSGEGLARRLIRALSRPIPYQDHQCRVGASIGLARREFTGQSAKAVLANADRALYAAKHGGRNRFELFDPVRHNGKAERPLESATVELTDAL